MAYLPGEGTMAPLLVMTLWHIYLMKAHWHIYLVMARIPMNAQ